MLFQNTVLVLLLLISANVWGEDAYTPKGVSEVYLYSSDSKKALESFEAIKFMPSDEFTLLKEDELNREVSAAAFYWLKISLDSASLPKHPYLVFSSRNLFDVQCLFYDSTGKLLEQSSGANLPFESHSVAARDIVFDISHCTNPSFIYVFIKGGAPISLGFELIAKKDYEVKSLNYTIITSGYIGIGIIMCVITLILYFAFRDTVFLWYVGIILSTLVGVLSENGWAFQYLWPSFPEFNLMSRGIIGTINVFFITVFARSMLTITKENTILYKLSRIQELLALVIVITFFVSDLVILSFSIGVFLTALNYPLIIAFISSAIKAKRPVAKYYLLGWSSLAIGSMIYILSELNVFSFTNSYLFIVGGAILEMTFFMVCVSIRVRTIKQEITALRSKTVELSKKEHIIHSDDVILPPHIAELSNREKEVLELMSKGLTDKEIAESLFLSTTTIKAHARNIYSKLQVRNRTEASDLGRKYGLF